MEGKLFPLSEDPWPTALSVPGRVLGSVSCSGLRRVLCSSLERGLAFPVLGELPEGSTFIPPRTGFQWLPSCLQSQEGAARLCLHGAWGISWELEPHVKPESECTCPQWSSIFFILPLTGKCSFTEAQASLERLEMGTVFWHHHAWF